MCDADSAPVTATRTHRNRPEPARAGTRRRDHGTYPSGTRDRSTLAILAILRLTAGRHTP